MNTSPTPPPKPAPSSERPTLPAAARMRLPAEFSRCMDAGKRIGGAYYRCIALLSPAAEPVGPRIGFAVSRKVDRRAVVRNRIKRVARELFRHQRANLPPGDYVLMGRREAASASTAELKSDLQRLMQRLCALKPPAPQVTMPADLSSMPAVGAPEPERAADAGPDSPSLPRAESVTTGGKHRASE